MAQQDILFLYIKSDNLIKVENLVKKSFGDDEIINDATVVMTLYQGASCKLKSGTAADKGAGTVGLPVESHLCVAGDTVRIWGTRNYNGVFTVASVSATEIVITATYVAEVFTGEEYFYKAVPGAINIACTATGTEGNYSGVLPDTADMVENQTYYLEIKVDKGDSNLLVRQTCKAVFFPKKELF